MPGDILADIVPGEEIDRKEDERTADEPADKGHAAEMKTLLGMFEIIIDRLEERSRRKAEQNGDDGVIKNEINKFGIHLSLLRVQEEDEKSKKQSHRNHDPVHMYVEKQCVR